MPTVIGFHCSHEQHPPSVLLRLAIAAERAGFGTAMCSDHFHPWSVRQGQSGNAWTWLGAALQATSLSFGTVCAPGQRYHPAIVAQQAATLSEMYPDRFWLAVGSGEALNETITGDFWIAKEHRHRRLAESVHVMRALWSGRTVDHHGLVRVKGARLFSLPVRPPSIVGAALSPETAHWMGGWADALITVAAERDRMRRIVDAFRAGGGDGKPLYLQVALAFAEDDAAAALAAHDQWRHAALTREQLSDLDSPAAFDAATDRVSVDAIRSKIRVSSDIERQIAWLHDDVTLGFTRVYLHNVVRDHERFFEACAARLIPEFRKL